MPSPLTHPPAIRKLLDLTVYCNPASLGITSVFEEILSSQYRKGLLIYSVVMWNILMTLGFCSLVGCKYVHIHTYIDGEQ